MTEQNSERWRDAVDDELKVSRQGLETLRMALTESSERHQQRMERLAQEMGQMELRLTQDLNERLLSLQLGMERLSNFQSPRMHVSQLAISVLTLSLLALWWYLGGKK